MSESTTAALGMQINPETGLPFASEQQLPSGEHMSTPERQSRVQRLVSSTKRAGHIALRGGQVSMALLEVSPANEIVTGAAGLATLGATHSPITTGLVYGAASWAMESIGAVSAAPLLGTDQSKKLNSWLNEKIANYRQKRGKEETLELSKTAKVVATTYLGSVVAMALESREDPTRTVAQNRKFGLWTSLWLGGVCAVEGAFISAGINLSVENPKIAAPAVAAAGIGYIGNRLRKTRENSQDMVEGDDPQGSESGSRIRYDLTPEELEELDRGLVDLAKENSPTEGIVGVWISPKSRFANLVRMHEASYFPEVEGITEEDEINTLFLALVDTRVDVNRVVHGATITGMSYDSIEKQMHPKRDAGNNSTGFYTVDSLIELGNFTAEEFYDYYNARGIRSDKCIAVETNFRIGEKAGKFNGFSPTDIAYLMFFNLLEQTGVKTGEGGVLATINKASLDSFKRVGLEFEPLMGRQDLVTEESLLGKESLPVLLPYAHTNQTLFGIMRDTGADVPVIFA